MRLLLLNDHYFSNTLKIPGLEIVSINCGMDTDVPFDHQNDSLPEFLARIGFKPDVVLQVDSIDTRIWYKGIEKIDVPVAFYAIDTPINEFWQKHCAYGFDRVYVDQYESWRNWNDEGINWVRWLPLAADISVFNTPPNGSERDIPIVFVGTLDSSLRPKRSAIIHRLQKLTDVKIIHGDGTRNVNSETVSRYYQRSRIVLNENLFDGINLRTFEAMATGAVVLTERNRGTERLFKNQEHLVTFDKDDLEETVQELLDNPGRCEIIGSDSVKEIRTKHTVSHRALQVLQDLKSLRTRRERLSMKNNLEYNWGLWQASWKWRDLENIPSEEAIEFLLRNADLLGNKKLAQVLEGLGERERAISVLCEEIDNNDYKDNTVLKLASILVNKGHLLESCRLLNISEGCNAGEIHTEIGLRLSKSGGYFTPGYNRDNYPSTGWNALEHFKRAIKLDINNLEALKGLDEVLAIKNSSEFSLSLWQKYHAHNPEDDYSMKMLRKRALEGYFNPAAIKRSKPHTWKYRKSKSVLRNNEQERTSYAGSLQ